MSSFNMHTYSKSQIDRAGETLRAKNPSSQGYSDALKVVNEWRTSHAYPINTFVATLRKKVSKYKDPLIAQRLKRLPTIVNKLSRQPEMSLSRMQDIGGVRAVVNTIKEVRSLQAQYQDQSRFTHELMRVTDYIEQPKSDGYRGVHLIFRYNNTLARNGLAEKFSGLVVEVQLRTKLQHTWATAVETAGTLLDESLKSDQGDLDWLEFFALVSSAFAIVEKSPLSPQHAKLNPLELFKAVAALEAKLGVLNRIGGLSAVAQSIHMNNIAGHYTLIILNKKERMASIIPYSKEGLSHATAEYARREAFGDPNIDLVLVSAGRLKSLKLAYPNYFLDVKDFIEKVKIIIDESTK